MEHEGYWEQILDMAIPEAHEEGGQTVMPHETSQRPRVIASASIQEATTVDPAAKKRMIDKAYRERSKRIKIETKKNLETCGRENDCLKGEINFLKGEDRRMKRNLELQEEEMKKLRKKCAILKEKYDSQNIVMEVLTKRLSACSNIDFEHENAKLRHKVALLTSQESHHNKLDKIHLEEKIAHLEQEKRALEVIVQALCEKINDEKVHKQEKAE